VSSHLYLVAILSLTGCDLCLRSDPHEPPELAPDAGPSGDPTVDAPPRGPTPILHYTFDDTLANDGTLGHDYDGTGTSISFVAGMRGRAVAFDTTQYTAVALPTQVPMSSHPAYTVGLWFREDAVWNSGGYTQYLIDTRGGGGFQTYHGFGGNQALTTCSAAGCQTFGYSVGTWHHLIYRHDGRAGDAPLDIFIDNVLVAMLPASSVYFSTTQKSLVVGTRTNMQVDELAVYADAFSREDQCAIVIGGTWTNGVCKLPAQQ